MNLQAHQISLSKAASFRIPGSFLWISTLSGHNFLLRANLPMIWYSNCTISLLWKTGITVSMLHYAFCWHQTDLQSSFIIHGHRLSDSQYTKWPRGPEREGERKKERKSQLNIPEGLTHTQYTSADTSTESNSEILTKWEIRGREGNVLWHKRERILRR